MTLSLQVVFIVLIALATHRVTRFITRDEFPPMCTPRNAFVERWGTFTEAKGEERRISISGKSTNGLMRSIAYLWECDWCTSVWVGAGLTYLTYRWSATMLWVLTAIVASTITGLIAQREPKD